MRYLPTPEQTMRLTPDELRAHFLVPGLFMPGAARFEMIDLDRVTLGGVVPLDQPIRLDAPEEFAATSFTGRRELGVLNIGGAGSVQVDGAVHQLGKRDMLYVGRGEHEIIFASANTAESAMSNTQPSHATRSTIH